MNLQQDISLKPYNSFGFDVKADNLVVFQDLATLQEVLTYSADHQLDLLVVGGGSNLILTSDIPGIVAVNRLMERSVQRDAGDFLVTAGAGENWHEFVRWTLAQGYNGLENLSLIPGTVGAAPMQNIGAYGVEIKDRMEYLDVLDRQTGALKRFTTVECDFGYRDSLFKRETNGRYVITSVTFRLTESYVPVLGYSGLAGLLLEQGVDSPTALQVSDLIIDIRRSKLPDPETLGNAGSFFKNPVIPKAQCQQLQERYPSLVSFADKPGCRKLAAGWMIDQLGWKGRQVGHAAVYDKQALVLVNRGDASGEDILNLADAIQQDVKQQFGVVLEIEPRIYPCSGR